ncbi:hypothetical protein [Bifidobacterium parmae]|uniref:hypothetical protein n=1 Tax=Bifidobacterium parmae TaxID=361854 RepID=UPI000C7569F4|nr:hypothetical protein [Bifidobacterium parmae]
MDRLAERLTRIHVDWLLYAVWFVVWCVPGSMADASLDLPQRMVLGLVVPFLPVLTLVCWRCMRVRNLRRSYWRYPGGVVALWFLTVTGVLVAVTELIA